MIELIDLLILQLHSLKISKDCSFSDKSTKFCTYARIDIVRTFLVIEAIEVLPMQL